MDIMWAGCAPQRFMALRKNRRWFLTGWGIMTGDGWGPWDLAAVPFDNPETPFAFLPDRSSGGANLQWIIDGAKMFIDNGYDFHLPQCVRDATTDYEAENDWLSDFLDAECIIDDRRTDTSSVVYQRYREHCDETGEYKRESADFLHAIEARGFRTHKGNGPRIIMVCVLEKT